jgi:hypothetical protein
MNEFMVAVLVSRSTTETVVRQQFCRWVRVRGSIAKPSFSVPSTQIKVDDKEVTITGRTNMPVEAIRETEASLVLFMQNCL